MLALAAHASSTLSWWDTFTRVGVVVSILLGVKGLGLFGRVRLAVHGGRSGLVDLAGLPTPSFFSMAFINRGSVAVTFYDFEIGQPRLGGDALAANGEFSLTTGAQWYLDGEEHGRIGANQAYSKVNLDSRRVIVEPRSSRTEIFDLTMFQEPGKYGDPGGTWPPGFAPILVFEDSFGNRYVADEHGVHTGYYKYPHQAKLDAALKVARFRGVSLSRPVIWPWWRVRDEQYPAP